MSLPLCTGSTLTCSMGLAPSVFVALPRPGCPLVHGAVPAATFDQTSPANILPFGLCTSQANPLVAAATAAAFGVPTPAPCLPLVVTPWLPPATGSLTTMLPMATTTSRCTCAYGGSVSVLVPFAAPLTTI